MNPRDMANFSGQVYAWSLMFPLDFWAGFYKAWSA